MNLDFLITILVLIILGLVIWAKVSKQTIGEVMRDIKDMFAGGGEEIEERVGGVIEYE